MNSITNDDLKKEMVPRKWAKWERIIEFSKTYESTLKVKMGDYLWNLTAEKEPNYSNLNLDELRAYLVYECRRFHHFNRDPDQNEIRKMYSLIDCIREKAHS